MKQTDFDNLQKSLDAENKSPEQLNLDKEGKPIAQANPELEKFVNWFASLGRQQKRKYFPELRNKPVIKCTRCGTPYNNVAFVAGKDVCIPCTKSINKSRPKRGRIRKANGSK